MNVNPFSYLIEKLKGKLDITGGTISGNLLIDRHNGTTNTDGQTILILGNTTPSGTDGNSYGIVRVCGKGNKYTDFEASLATSNQLIKLPNASGTVALASDLNWNLIQANIETGTTINFDATKYHEIMIVPMANGSAWYNPFTVTSDLPSNVYFSVYQDGTYHAAAHIVYNSGTKRITYTTDSVVGWARLYITIYAR